MADRNVPVSARPIVPVDHEAWEYALKNGGIPRHTICGVKCDMFSEPRLFEGKPVTIAQIACPRCCRNLMIGEVHFDFPQ